MSTAPSADRLVAIRARCEAATPGPWFSNAGLLVDVAAPGKANDGQTVCRMPGGAASRSSHDADFIAHAREDVPWLLAEIALLAKRSALDETSAPVSSARPNQEDLERSVGL